MTLDAVAVLKEWTVGESTEELEGIVARIRRAIRGLDQDALERPEGPGRWSVAQVIRHFADVELAYAVRIRLAIAQDDPAYPPIEPNAWIERHGAIDIDEALSLLGLLRRTTLRLVRNAGPGALHRTGRHPTFGRMTVLDMIERIASHDQQHLRQIARIRIAVAPDAVAEALRHDGMIAAHMNDIAPRSKGGREVRDLWNQSHGPARALAVEIPAGAVWEGIDHHEPGPEEVFVARGTFVDDGKAYREGSFIHYPAGTAHAPSSPDGCLLYVFYPEG